MIRHVWSVFCVGHAVDRRTNAVSLFEVIEGLNLEVAEDVEFPFTTPFHASLVTNWAREDPDAPVEGQQQIRLLSPEGDELGVFRGDINLEDTPRNRNFSEFLVIRISGTGRHEWEVS